MGFSALDETMPAVRKCEENIHGQNRSAAVTVGGGAEKTENSSSSIAILFLVVYHSQQSVGIHKTEYTGL